MIKLVIVLLLALPLTSFAPLPAPLPRATIARPVVQTIVVPRRATIYRLRLAVQTSAPAMQACSYEIASAKLSATVSDPIGYPYGFVTAFSCSGDGLAVANELAARVAQMQAEAAAYRAAHPIAGLR